MNDRQLSGIQSGRRNGSLVGGSGQSAPGVRPASRVRIEGWGLRTVRNFCQNEDSCHPFSPGENDNAARLRSGVLTVRFGKALPESGDIGMSRDGVSFACTPYQD